MNRRSFFARILAGAAAIVGAKRLLKAAKPDDHGISIRHIQTVNSDGSIVTHRINVLYGFQSTFPEWTCRITSGPDYEIARRLNASERCFNPSRLPA